MDIFTWSGWPEAISNQGVKIGESKLNVSFWSRSIYLKQQSPRFCPVSSIFLVSILDSQPSPRSHNSFTAPQTHCCCSVFFRHFPWTPWTGAKINNLTCSMSLGPLYVTFDWKCGNGKGQRHYQFNLWFAMTSDQDHLMAWLPFCLSRLDWFAKANPCNHSCQSWTFCADSPHFKRFKHFKLANISHFSKTNSTIWKPFVIGLTLTQITKETFEQESLLKLSFSQNSF